MGHIVQPGHGATSGASVGRLRESFVSQVFRQYGLRGLIVLICAALLAVLPLVLLIWFNSGRLTSLVATQVSAHVVVKSGRLEQELEADRPGETGLLQIRCEIPTIDGWTELLRADDPRRLKVGLADTCYVRQERVYLRKAGDSRLPFGMLGPPPVSVWLPAGDYEVAVVHEAPPSRSMVDPRTVSFPLVTVVDSCKVSDREQVVLRIPLPHYEWGHSEPIGVAGEDVDETNPVADVSELARAIERLVSIPTPGGCVLALAEPEVNHVDGHQGCTADFHKLGTVTREWNRDQLATLRGWMPATETAARSRLLELVRQLQWHQMLEGWFCYALAGVSALVLTKWGTLAILEPYRRREHLKNSMNRCLLIFLIAAAGWYFWSR